MTWIWIWLLNSISVYVTSKILGGVEIKSFWNAVWVAALLAVVNTFLKPVLEFFSFPAIIITFGLFIIVIDALLIMLVDALVAGFKVKNFGWALGFGLVMSVISSVLLRIFA